MSVIPVTTELLGAYHGKDSQRTAAMEYAGRFFLTGASFDLLWWYANHAGRLINQRADPSVLLTVTRRYRVGAPVYLLAFIVAWFSAAVSLAICFAVALFYVLPSSSGSR